MQRLLCLSFPGMWSLQLLSWLDHVNPSNHSQALWWLWVSLNLLSNAMSWFVSRLLFVWVMDLAPSTQWLQCLFVGEWYLLINSLTVFVCSSHHQLSRFGCLHTKFSPFWAFLNQVLGHQDVWIQLYCSLIKELTYSQWTFIAKVHCSQHLLNFQSFSSLDITTSLIYEIPLSSFPNIQHLLHPVHNHAQTLHHLLSSLYLLQISNSILSIN